MRPSESSPLLPNGHEEAEDDVVSWDGPDDVENPANWSDSKIWEHVIVVSSLTFLVPLGATMFAPAIEQVMDEFNSSNPALSPLVVSIYILGWALGPLLLGPLSEIHGRLAVYTCSNALYVLATAGCALAPSATVLILCRFAAGALGATPLTLGGGTIADIVPVRHRALALSAYMFGPVLGPCVGPPVGGLLSERLGWRSIFWALGGLYAAVTAAQVLVMRETYPAAVLARKTGRLQRKTGNCSLRSGLDDGLSRQPLRVFGRAIARPAKVTVLSPVNLTLSIISAYVNGLVFLLLTTAPVVFQTEYGFSAREVGLAFVGYGGGNLIGLAAFTSLTDRLIRKRTAKGTLRVEDRLSPAVVAAPLLIAGLLLFGWSAQAHMPSWIPVAGSAVIGAGNVLFFSAVIGYLIDAFPVYAASAVAANIVVRSIGGALMPLLGRSLYLTLGWGWGSSVLAAIPVLFTPVLLYLYLYGDGMREKYPLSL